MDVTKVLRERRTRDLNDGVQQDHLRLGGSAIDDLPRSCERERSRSVEASEQALQSSAPTRRIQLMLKNMNTGKILKGRGTQACINKWEGYMNMLESDYKETNSNRMCIGILVRARS